MRKLFISFFVALFALLGANLLQAAIGIDQAKPGDLPPDHPPISTTPVASAQPMDDPTPQLLQQDRTAFEQQINLAALRILAVHHHDQLKILDSWARQSLTVMSHRSRINGQDPLYTVLDMTFRPEVWADQNILYIRDVPLRRQLALLAPTSEEQQRIITKATLSPRFLERPESEDLLQRVSADTLIAQSVNRVLTAAQTFSDLWASLELVPSLESHEPWHHPVELQGNVPEAATRLAADGRIVKPLPGYSADTARQVVLAARLLAEGWRNNDVAEANRGIDLFTQALPAVNPPDYPTSFTRNLELWYNRTFNGTLGVFAYFIALTLFLLAAVGAAPRLRTSAMVFFTGAVAFHGLSMAARWWIAGRIPIQNQFESVLGAALFGCLVGLALEIWRKNNLFGLAMSFVGFLAMTACLVFPFVLGTEMGASIAPVAGILADYWLYIHVNIVISSYALIGASFLLGAVYLLAKLWFWTNPIENTPVASAVAVSATIANGDTTSPADSQQANSTGSAISSARRRLLEQIDAANIVILQMAFWFLGTGIICGAIWADHSWGRPWGWDPKETFALVTWIVYLIIVHVRFVTPRNRATWTAALAVVGFAVMLFNWIGVNFFLAGLHSYA